MAALALALWFGIDAGFGIEGIYGLPSFAETHAACVWGERQLALMKLERAADREDPLFWQEWEWRLAARLKPWQYLRMAYTKDIWNDVEAGRHREYLAEVRAHLFEGQMPALDVPPPRLRVPWLR